MRMVAIHRGIEKLCKDRNKLSFKQTKSLFKKKDKEKSNVPHFLCKYGKDRDKAHKVYFNGARADTMEKVIETNFLADIISEAGKGTNIPYLRGGERLIREVLKEISQSRMI